MNQTTQTHHATAVAMANRAVLILGPSGSGKSSLALELLSRGARLVSDDRTQLDLNDGQVIASAPPTIAGLIEARGVGLLNAPVSEPVPVTLVVDLAVVENARLPEVRFTSLLGQPIRCFARVDAPHFPAAILLCLSHGISEPS